MSREGGRIHRFQKEENWQTCTRATVDCAYMRAHASGAVEQSHPKELLIGAGLIKGAIVAFTVRGIELVRVGRWMS